MSEQGQQKLSSDFTPHPGYTRALTSADVRKHTQGKQLLQTKAGHKIWSITDSFSPKCSAEFNLRACSSVFRGWFCFPSKSEALCSAFPYHHSNNVDIYNFSFLRNAYLESHVSPVTSVSECARFNTAFINSLPTVPGVVVVRKFKRVSEYTETENRPPFPTCNLVPSSMI